MPNDTVAGETAALGTPVAVPLRATVWLLAVLPALSLMVNVALRAPAAVGPKVTEIEQVPDTAMLPVQVLAEIAKSSGLVPVMETPEIVSAPVPPLVSVTVCAELVVPTLWLLNVSEVGEGVAAGTPTPVPLSDPDCVDPVTLPALSVTVSVAVRLPIPVGLKVTETRQVPATATVPEQLFVVAKSVAFVPLITTLAIVSGPLPELLSVNVWALLVLPTFWSVKVSPVGVRDAVGEPVPVPLSETVCVAPVTLPALSVMVSVPLRAPEAAGVKPTVMVQVEPATSVAPQLLVSEKSPELALPPIVMLAIVNGPVPELVMVTLCAAAATPTAVLGNVRVVGEAAAEGTATPVPVRVTVCVVPETLLALSVIVMAAPRVPAAVGVKVTEIEQLAEGAKVVPQVLAEIA